MKFSVRRLVGENCITSDDGVRIYEQIHPELLADREVYLDFAGTQVFASPFFNAAIGRLFEDITSEKLNRRLHLDNLAPNGRSVLARVVDNSKRFYGSSELRGVQESVLRELEDR